MLGSERQLIESYLKTGQLRLVFNPVLNHGDRSRQSHQGAECAAEQGRFWEFREFLFEHQDRLWQGDSREGVKALAAELGLDSAAFNACLDEQRTLSLIEAQDTRRINRGIRFQPSFEINGEFMFGPQRFEVFQQVIEGKLGL